MAALLGFSPAAIMLATKSPWANGITALTSILIEQLENFLPMLGFGHGSLGVARREHLDPVIPNLLGDQIALVAHGLIEHLSQFRFRACSHWI
jgi:hypothetical protein